MHHARSAEDVSGRQHARRDVEADARRAREARAAVVGFLELRAVEAREARESRDRGLEEARRAASQAEAAPTAVEDRRAVEAQDQDRELRRTIRELEAAEALLAGVRFGERESREQEREAYRAIGRAEEAPLIRFGADPPRWRENVGLSSSQRSEHPRPRSFADLRSDRALPGDTRRPPGDDWQFVEDVSIPPPEPLDQLAGFRGLAVSDSYRSMGRSEADLTRVRRVPDVATARTQATPPPSQFLRPSSEPRPLLPEPQFFSGPVSIIQLRICVERRLTPRPDIRQLDLDGEDRPDEPGDTCQPQWQTEKLQAPDSNPRHGLRHRRTMHHDPARRRKATERAVGRLGRRIARPG